MNELDCERVLMAKMAELDGEKPEIFGERVNLHIEQCGDCRREIEQMQYLDHVLQGQERRLPNVDLWPAVEKHIGPRTASQIGWGPFALIAVLLVAYKLFEMLPERDPGMAFKIVPLVVLTALFIMISENPFKIDPELILEK